MKELWNPQWDPYQVLMDCQHNLMDIAEVVNANHGVTVNLNDSVRHQQEVIEQLMFQNKKHIQMMDLLKNQLIQLATEIQILKAKAS
jgi:hypothetical protein